MKISNSTYSFCSIITIACILFTGINSSAQKKVIKLNDELSNYSKPLAVKVKGGFGMYRYSFGDFEVLSTKNESNSIRKNEIRDTISGVYFGSSYSEYKEDVWGSIEQDQNFVFLGHSKDTVLVRMGISYKHISNVDSENRSKSSSEVTIIRNSNEKFIAFLNSSLKTNNWIVEMDTQLGKDVKAKGGIISKGTLTDGIRVIEIVPIREWSNGKTSKMFPILGFEFIFDGNSIAAVQKSKNSMHKMFVWIKNDLPEDLELILATAATAVMAMVDNQLARQ